MATFPNRLAWKAKFRPIFPVAGNAQLEQNGFAILRGVLDRSEVDALRARLAEVACAEELKRSRIGGARNLLERVQEVRKLVGIPPLQAILGEGWFPVRGIFFDKTADANWGVPWHQDLFIAVKERREVEGFSSWSIKAGVVHTQPPLTILQQMLTVRFHLDDCGEGNGPLQVLPGSHKAKLSTEEISEWKQRTMPITCKVNAGDAVIMRPLLLHASSPSAAPSHRRVIHLELANCQLPGGLQWSAESE